MDRGFFRGYRTHHNFVMPIFVISIFPPDYSPRTYLKKKSGAKQIRIGPVTAGLTLRLRLRR